MTETTVQKTTMTNLMEAFTQKAQATILYDFFAKKAEEEGFKQISNLFKMTTQAEAIHANLLMQAVQAAKSNQYVIAVDYYVCSACGNTIENSAPETCSICGAQRRAFFKVA